MTREDALPIIVEGRKEEKSTLYGEGSGLDEEV